MRRTIGLGPVLGFFCLLSFTTPGLGQSDPPPRPDLPADLDRQADRMADELRRLTDDVATDLAQRPEARALAQQTQELAQALVEYRASLANAPDLFQLRRGYSGIDQNWHQLQAQLTQPGFATPVVARDTGRIAEIDARIHRALGMNDSPPSYYASTRPLQGVGETRRLAHALVDRAEAFAAIARAEMVGPGGARLVQDGANLAQVADAFHDGLDMGASPDLARNGFAGVEAVAETTRRDLAALIPPAPARVSDAWGTFVAVEVLVRQNLGLANAPENLVGTAIPVEGPSPVVALADQLVEQGAAFLQVFTPTAGIVPEGAWILGDAQQLQAAADQFRKDVARGLDPGQLAFEFRNVDFLWQRLARRTNRIARGRTGPNIQQIGRMGQTVGEIHRLLGMPGYPPTVVLPAG